jgi:hypothetical protein
MVRGKHQITNKFPCLPAPVPTEGGAGRNYPNSKPPHLSPLPRGERDGVRAGHLKLIFGIYLGFVIWNLGFQNATFSD